MTSSSGMLPVLQMSHVNRSYKVGQGARKTSRTVLTDINLYINSGEVLCLVGPNGAGKTTTVKIAGTLLAPDSGEVRIAGIDAVNKPHIARSHMSLLLGGESGFYRSVSALDNLRYFADLAAVPFRERDKRIAAALERVGLSDKAKDRVQTFSRGMWQRLHIARSIVAQSELLLLDEPTTGLDPENTRNIRALVQELRASGTAILLTTHEMSEAEKLADSVAVINHGEIIARGKVGELASHQHIDHISVYAFAPDADVDGGLSEESKQQLDSVETIRWYEASQAHGVWNLTVAWAIPAEQSENVALPFDDVQLIGNRTASLEETYLSILHNEHSGEKVSATSNKYTVSNYNTASKESVTTSIEGDA